MKIFYVYEIHIIINNVVLKQHFNPSFTSGSDAFTAWLHLLNNFPYFQAAVVAKAPGLLGYVRAARCSIAFNINNYLPGAHLPDLRIGKCTITEFRYDRTDRSVRNNLKRKYCQAPRIAMRVLKVDSIHLR